MHRRDPCVVKTSMSAGSRWIFELFETVFKADQRDLHAGLQRVLSPCRSGRVFSVMDEEPEAADDKDAVSMDGMRGEVVLDQ